MNIVVCVKQVPASNEARMDPVTNTVIRENVESILNPFDAFAVEEAVRLKARCDGSSVMAISMGVPSAAQMLRGVIAVGVDQAMLLTDRAFAGADHLGDCQCAGLCHWNFAPAGSDSLRPHGHRRRHRPGGAHAGRGAGHPHVTDVAEIVEAGEHSVVVRKLTDDGYQVLQVPLPALLSVTKEINVPRLPSIAGVLRGAEAEVQICSAAQLGVDPARVGLAGSVTKVVRTMRPDHRVKSEVLEGSVPEQTRALLERLREKKLV